MKKSRKWISLLLSLVMVLTIIPFSALSSPKANAATAGKYRWRTRLVSENATGGWNDDEFRAYGCKTNGTAGQTSNAIVSKDDYEIDFKGERTNTFGTNDNYHETDEFPTKMTYWYSFGGGATWRELRYYLYLEVWNFNTSSWQNVPLNISGSKSSGDLSVGANGGSGGSYEQRVQAKSSAFTTAKGTITYTAQTAYYPKPTSLSLSNGSASITTNAPGGGNKDTTAWTATVKDQYGVVWGATSPEWSVSAMNYPASMTSASGDSSAMRVAPPAANSKKVTNTIKAVCTYSSYSASATASCTVTPTYRIRLNANGGSLASGTNDTYTQTNTSTSSNTITFSASGKTATRSGYTFKGWSTSNTATTGSTGNITVGYDDTLYACWQRNTTNLTVKPNGGVWTDGGATYTADKSFTINSSDEKTIADPTRNGYTFTGWQLGGDSAGTWTASTKKYKAGLANANDTLTAGWSAPLGYTITFDANGGSAVSAKSYNIESTGTINASTSRSGYTFLGWKPTAAVGNWNANTTYANSEALVGKYGNVTLKAQWTPTAYTITFDTAGADPIAAKAYDIESTDTLPEPVLPGYTFGGWKVTSAQGSWQQNATYAAGTSVTGRYGDVTLTAQWTKDTYPIAYDLGGGSVATPNPATYQYDTPDFTLNNPTRTGYTFVGWSGTGLTGNDNQTVTVATNSTGARSYTANWEPIGYTIAFDVNGGDALADKTYTIESTDTLPTPTRTGYHFTGWTVAAADGNWSGFVSDGASLNGRYGSPTLKANWEVNKYTIRFNSNGGSGEMADLTQVKNPVTNEYEDLCYTSPSFRLPAKTFTRRGYDFLGWSTDQNQDPDAFAPKPAQSDAGYYPALGQYQDQQYIFKDHALTAEKDGVVVLYAVWKIHNYTVTLDLDGGSYDGVNYVKEFTNLHVDDTITLTVPVKTGNDFTGWILTEGNVGIAPNADGTAVLTVQESDAFLQAQWDPHGYKLHVDPNGGEFRGQTAVVTRPGYYNDEIHAFTSETIEAPTRDGYEFTGWTYTPGADGGGEWDYDEATQTGEYTFSGDATLTANWTPITYNIVFDADGGEGTMADITGVEYGASVTLPASTFTKTGYRFGGWSIGGAEYGDGATVSNLVKVKGETAVLKAVWLPNTYTVRFNAVGGNGTMEPQEFEYGTAQNLTANAYSKTGMHVAGWATAEGGELVYEDGESVINLTAVNGAVIDLYAVWAKNTYTVEFNAAGGTGEMANQSFEYNEQKALTSNAFTRTGYKFGGWATSAGGAAVYSDAQTVMNLSENHGVTIRLFAVWTPITYTVVFHSNNGADTTVEQSFTYDQSQTLTLNTFSKTGYTFVKWTENDDGSGAGYGNGFTVDSTTNLTAEDGAVIDLYAKWRANAYSVIFNSCPPAWYIDESASTQQSFFYDEAQNLTANEWSFDGFNFLGWSRTSVKANQTVEFTDGQEVVNLATAGAVTLYAVWEPVEYTFTVDDSNGNVTEESFTLDADNRYYQLPIPEKEGYHLIGWTLTFGDGSEPQTVSFTPGDLDSGTYNYPWAYNVPVEYRACNITAKAIWEINKYRITFDNPETGEYFTLVAEHGGSLNAADLPAAAEFVRVDENWHKRFSAWVSINGESFSNITSEFAVVATYNEEMHEEFWVRAEGDDAYLAPGCEEMGYENFVCVCGETKHVDYPAAGHSVGAWEFDEATHTHTGTCTVCKQPITEACTFDKGEVINTSYTASDAIKRYTCTECGGYYDEPWQIPAHTHTGGYASCIDRAHCVFCGMPYGEYDNHLHGTIITVEGVDPTCTEKGYSAYEYCERCGEITMKKQTIPALGHIDEDQDYICDRCGEELPGGGDNGGINVDPSGGHMGTSYSSFECTMCAGGKQVTGFNAVIHFFVHLVQYIGYLFGRGR